MELSYCSVEPADRLHVVGLRHLACGHIVGDPPADLLELSQCVAQCQPGLPREEHFIRAEPAPFGFAAGFVGTLAMTWAAVSARSSSSPSGRHHVAAPLTVRADFHHSDVRGATVLRLLIGGRCLLLPATRTGWWAGVTVLGRMRRTEELATEGGEIALWGHGQTNRLSPPLVEIRSIDFIVLMHQFCELIGPNPGHPYLLRLHHRHLLTTTYLTCQVAGTRQNTFVSFHLATIAAMMNVEVIRSSRRRKTVSAQVIDGVLRVSIPAHLSNDEEAHWVDAMRQRFDRRRAADRVDLTARAAALSRRFGLRHAHEVVWSERQRTRWGSCTIDTARIRISTRIASAPDWVLDYVIVHELAHLSEPNHSKAFWALVNRFPKAERARGYLLAKAESSA